MDQAALSAIQAKGTIFELKFRHFIHRQGVR
jgi:hypothetical protein